MHWSNVFLPQLSKFHVNLLVVTIAITPRGGTPAHWLWNMFPLFSNYRFWGFRIRQPRILSLSASWYVSFLSNPLFQNWWATLLILLRCICNSADGTKTVVRAAHSVISACREYHRKLRNSDYSYTDPVLWHAKQDIFVLMNKCFHA